MNTKMILGLVVVIVVVAGVYYGMSNDKSAAVSAAPATRPAALLSFKELIAQGVSEQCAFGADASTTGTHGTVYVGGGKVRGDFVSMQEGKPKNGHAIADGTDVYTWIEGMPSGFKMSMMVAKSGDTTAPQHEFFDADSKMNYTCSPWSMDPSKFTLPTNIPFKDMAAMLQDALKGSGVR